MGGGGGVGGGRGVRGNFPAAEQAFLLGLLECDDTALHSDFNLLKSIKLLQLKYKINLNLPQDSKDT